MIETRSSIVTTCPEGFRFNLIPDESCFWRLVLDMLHFSKVEHVRTESCLVLAAD